MDSNVTRISDLPSMDSHGGQGGMNAYSQMNVHPNPYLKGNPQNPPIQVSQHPLPSMNGGGAGAPGYIPDAQMHLPSRDIPMDMANLVQDRETQPNYMPSVSDIHDFVTNHEFITEEKVDKHNKVRTRAEMIDQFIEEVQTPVFVSILFFIFQMPIFTKILVKYLGNFVNILNSEGNLNFNGILLKSFMFGSAYYWSMKITSILASL
jgi:hypothetical protein